MKPDPATCRSANPVPACARQRPRNRLARGVVATMAVACLVSIGLPAQQLRPSADQVEAAYIYNFGKFVKWPAASVANRSNSFTICVLGQDPFGSVLQSTLAGQSLGGRLVSIQRIPTPQNAAACRILFLNAGEKNHLQKILAALGQVSVLTVSDMPDFSRRGGMIQFVLEGDRVRFEINRASAEDAGLVLTSDLLKVAAEVLGTGRTGDQ
jgi:hypothetical protein